MIKKGHIRGDRPIQDDQIQPSSIDLRTGTVAWRVQASFLTGKEKTIQTRLQEMAMHELDIKGGTILEKGCVYVVKLQENLSIPNKINAVANAKSSIGRLDLLTRLITDFGTEFDRVPPGYSGPLYIEISPKSFSVLIRSGIRLNQIRFRKGYRILSDKELISLNKNQKLVSNDAIIDNGLSFSVNLDNSQACIVGYKAKSQTKIIDLEKTNFYKVLDFWHPIETNSKSLILDPGAFYILMTKETVHIPPNYAAEMSPYLAMVGEFRVHYAGFFDPGFGHEAQGGQGSKGVLEVRCHETPFNLQDGQSVGRLLYEEMLEIPDILYGSSIKSNYQGQQLKLSKHFEEEDKDSK